MGLNRLNRLKTLDSSWNKVVTSSSEQLDDNHAVQIGSLLPTGESVERLKLENMKLVTAKGWDALITGMTGHSSLTELYFGHVKLDHKISKNLANALRFNWIHVTKLELYEVIGIDENILNVLDALQENMTIEYLSLISCIRDTSLDKQARQGQAIQSLLLVEYNNLKHLYFSKNPLGDRGVAELAFGLTTNGKLQFLDLGECGISSEGAMAVAHAVSYNQTVRTVVLSRNQIGNMGANAIALMIESSVSLQQLWLDHNPIQVEGIVELARALSMNPTLIDFNVQFFWNQ